MSRVDHYNTSGEIMCNRLSYRGHNSFGSRIIIQPSGEIGYVDDLNSETREGYYETREVED